MVIQVDKGGKGHYRTVQEAVDSVPCWNTQRIVIVIHTGLYREKVTVPYNKPFITFKGSGRGGTIISWGDTANIAGGTYESTSVAIDADYFIAKGMTFTNTAPIPSPGAIGKQAVALRVNGNKAAFYNCQILGAQDTLFDAAGLHLFKNCFIQGTIDFIFGNGQSLYLGCILNSIASTYGSIAAQNRQEPQESTGFSFVNCKITGTGLLYLGRAMGPYSRIVFSNTYIDNIIAPDGWNDWFDAQREKTVFYGQYKCSGPGSNTQDWVPWSHVLSNDEAQQYQSLNFIDGTEWLKV
ncbi:hypothetical protein O6H91_04G087300 [Diphasiastrum complanatum]|uniref:Uncharacterized protein n=1 Tax=Diphasiastrum complanatum TaxID=34168 RepID=A0ACC2DZG1_DIPCM|nr:hypothetical protein O6H91_04G087300 [Diphasiastrum complanatum]